MKVPFHIPSIGQEEVDEVVRTLKSGWLTTGPRTAQFEREFREYVQAPYAQAVNSCTAGLHLVLAALGIGPGDEVITTPLTFCATVNVILHTGATPVLADVLPNGNIDPASIRKRITGRTRAIMPVHLSGLPCEMNEIWTIAEKHGLHVIEDAAHAAGSHYRGRPIGAEAVSGRCSTAAVFSFYATKNMTTGEGGMVTTHDPDLASRIKVLCLHGISKDAWNRYSDKGNWYYEVLEPGFKYNLTDIQSSLGLHQLRKLEQFIAARHHYVEMYNAHFADVTEVEAPPIASGSRSAWHLYMLRLNLSELEIDRNQFINELRAREIGTSVHFIPIPLHPFFREFRERPENQCPGALELYHRLVSLPLYPAMTPEQVKFTAEAVKDIVQKARKTKALYMTAGV
jgi:dTDP-4-amino-4,6-dideoxygalactose transaminase